MTEPVVAPAPEPVAAPAPNVTSTPEQPSIGNVEVPATPAADTFQPAEERAALLYGNAEGEAGANDTPAESAAAETAEDETAEGEAPPAAVDMAKINIPEGTEINQQVLDDFGTILNDTGTDLSQKAQLLVDLQLKVMEGADEAASVAWEQTHKLWRDQVKALPELGGANVNRTIANIKRGLMKVGATEHTWEAFNVTGAGDHPEIVKVLHKLTAPLVEPETPAVSQTPKGGDLSQADRLYGVN